MISNVNIWWNTNSEEIRVSDGNRVNLWAETHRLTLAHPGVSSSSVFRASDKITEGRGFKSHLGLEFFSEFVLLHVFTFEAKRG